MRIATDCFRSKRLPIRFLSLGFEVALWRANAKTDKVSQRKTARQLELKSGYNVPPRPQEAVCATRSELLTACMRMSMFNRIPKSAT